MRYILSLALLVSACTRANSDYAGGNGGSAGGGGGGAAGSGGGGAAGSGGGGGGNGADLAMTDAHDMAHGADMATLDGVACGMTSCKGNQPDCCINNQGPMCTGDNSCSGGNHPTLWACDGPEDCPGPAPGTHQECCATTAGSACDDSCALVSTGAAPMCHSLGDCPAAGGYVACCVVKALPQYALCAKNACPP